MRIRPKRSVGLFITNGSLELVELTKSRQGVVVSSINRIKIKKDNIIANGRIKNKKRLSHAINILFDGAKPYAIKNRNVVLCLPEMYIFTKVIKIEQFQDKMELKRSIIDSIPLPSNNIIFSYRLHERKKNSRSYFVVAAARDLIQEWQKFLDSVDVTVKFLDTESQAIYRGLTHSKKRKEPLTVVDIGSDMTHLFSYCEQGVCSALSVSRFGGNLLTEDIAKVLKVSEQKAEKEKIRFGMRHSDAGVVESINKNLGKMVRELKQVLTFYSRETNKPINRIILIGGTSKLKGLVVYFNSFFTQSFVIGKPRLLKNTKWVEFVQAIGAGLRGLDSTEWQDDLVLDLGQSLVGGQIGAISHDVTKGRNGKKKKSKFKILSMPADKERIAIIVMAAIILLLLAVLFILLMRQF